MTEEKNIDASQKENHPQEKLAAEHLNDEQLDNIAGGIMPDPGDVKSHDGTSGK